MDPSTAVLLLLLQQQQLERMQCRPCHDRTRSSMQPAGASASALAAHSGRTVRSATVARIYPPTPVAGRPVWPASGPCSAARHARARHPAACSTLARSPPPSALASPRPASRSVLAAAPPARSCSSTPACVAASSIARLLPEPPPLALSPVASHACAQSPALSPPVRGAVSAYAWRGRLARRPSESPLRTALAAWHAALALDAVGRLLSSTFH
mmetsp:Transcript_20709/g.34672  ORF Transcript_20709/g.34672 Transcript_20709/m.34672 type:complete len:213 (+) Transcript_20709:1737-2375(+)